MSCKVRNNSYAVSWINRKGNVVRVRISAISKNEAIRKAGKNYSGPKRAIKASRIGR